jgi:hypothetical protein
MCVKQTADEVTSCKIVHSRNYWKNMNIKHQSCLCGNSTAVERKERNNLQGTLFGKRKGKSMFVSTINYTLDLECPPKTVCWRLCPECSPIQKQGFLRLWSHNGLIHWSCPSMMCYWEVMGISAVGFSWRELVFSAIGVYILWPPPSCLLSTTRRAAVLNHLLSAMMFCLTTGPEAIKIETMSRSKNFLLSSCLSQIFCHSDQMLINTPSFVIKWIANICASIFLRT